MKKISICLVSFLFISLVLSSCLKDECELKRTFYRYDPIYVSKQQIIDGFKISGAKSIEETGKIYNFKQYLFINEPKKGIHIIDNTLPKSPIAISFIAIPGNVDMAVRDGILYADNYMDMLAIDITNPTLPKLSCRVENVFEPIMTDPVRGLLVDYAKTEQTQILSCTEANFNRDIFFEGDVIFSSTDTKNQNNRSFTGLTGIGGSLARFTIVDDYLYTVDQTNLFSFNISATCPKLSNKSVIGWNIETIYPYGGNLFIGSTSGMFIYTLTNPGMPVFASQLQHWSSCDPVVVEGDVAYVTLHGGTACGGFTNQLDIINVKSIYSPILLKTYPMSYPLGLSVYNNTLYLCDDGLKIYNVSDWKNIQLQSHVPIVDTYDVILLSESHLILVGSKGLYQYDVTLKNKPELLSLLSVTGK